MIIKRDIFSRLKEELKRKQITALVGARQVGKTTLLKEIQKITKNKKQKYISFDDLEILNLFENNLQIFIEKYILTNEIIFIDEFQYAKDGGKKLKFIYDTIKNIKIFISGSSNPELAIHSLQYLVGRISIIEIHPLSFKEFISFKSNENLFLFDKKRESKSFDLIKKEFEEFLKYGGYPEVVLEKDYKYKEILLKDLINSYLLKEIRDILEYKDIYEFENLLIRLALQDCKILNKNSISEDLGIEYRKLSRILNVLNKTYILYLLQPFLKNKIREQIKSPKTILADLGFKNSLIKNFNDLNLKVDKGEIYENFVFNELIKMEIRPNFFNEQNRYEIDFIFENNGEITGIECKSKLNQLKLTNSMKRFIETFKPQKLIIFNENLDGNLEFNNCKIIFTNYLNIYSIDKL